MYVSKKSDDALTVNDQLNLSQGHATSPIHDIHSPVSNQSIAPQGLTTAPIYDKHSSINIFGLNISPNYNLPVTCTTNPRNIQLSFSDNSLSSDAEDQPQWLIKLEKKYSKKILDWDNQMMKDWQEVLKKFQQDWNMKVQIERSRLIEQLQAELNEEKRKRLVKEQQ
ncbi:unnamed protein product [Rotaria sordida]|uniref:Uncharacterized protein n=1 Tax=Rotaria sordida TaxID=392033 RepID=A0A815XCL6_9BILA|nr:unnamed protein product [Rotaria sordida]CAF1555750.1 unnamed protein product [Rotaria sordida]